MKIVKHYEDIYEIQDFLNEEELSTLLLSATDGDFEESKEIWNGRPSTGNVVKDLNAQSLALIPKISDKIMSFFENAHSHTKIANIRQLKPGEHMPVHKDEGYPDSNIKIIYGVVIYLNDNFSGGLLNYPKLKISIKPKAGSMVIHNSQIHHKVLKVKSGNRYPKPGNRYSLTTFIIGDEKTKFKNQ